MIMVNTIPYVENLVDPFTKTLTGRVCVSGKDSIGFRWVSGMLYKCDALKASGKILG